MNITNQRIASIYTTIKNKLPEGVEVLSEKIEAGNSFEHLLLLLENNSLGKRLELWLSAYASSSIYVDARFISNINQDPNYIFQGYFDLTEDKIDEYINWITT